MKYAIGAPRIGAPETLFMFDADRCFKAWAEYGHDVRERPGSYPAFEYLEISAEAFEALRGGRPLERLEWPELTAYALDLDEVEA